ncbi:MAG: right-handed parallel beta-helix repeat-containing protein [Phycisphaerae bacterium]|nr:right-handed parallel beta-helix repeat-containing protein [Phycisphaerae bacterium]
MMKCAVLWAVMASAAVSAASLPEVVVQADDTVIDKSCRVVIPARLILTDANGNGVIHVRGDGIEVEFAPGSVLCGAAEGVRPDAYRGYGIRIDGGKNVTIRGARIRGYWCGLWATGADGLTLEGIDASDNRRAHLRSTPAAEDGADWLFPHNNDANEWLNNYAAAIYIEDASRITVRDCTVRQGQNALCLDRVIDSRVYDNDFSFNSGWGIAMWRCERNIITRNACDFCIRGYSHNVYNRGQDSAGILMFEQNIGNVIAENSATHGGDGFFGFAGREALGETGTHDAAWYKRRGNNDNRLIANDFSHCAAHGIEMTFSFGNLFYGNRLVDNAICGVWGGYSQDTTIAFNTFEANGGMAYGLERGGVNIEHGRGSLITDNTFRNNACGVHLWWDEEGDFGKRPWALANGTASTDNLIARNRFEGDTLAFHLRGPSEATIADNHLIDVKRQMDKEDSVTVTHQSSAAGAITAPKYPVYGRKRPVGARPHLRGRDKIIMTEWGPWDHASPLIREISRHGDSITCEFHKMPADVKVNVHGSAVRGKLTANKEGVPTYTVSATRPGAHDYTLHVTGTAVNETLRGMLIHATWQATFFKWDASTDPRQDAAAWRKLAQGPTAAATKVDQLRFNYGYGGPGDQNVEQAVKAAGLGGDRFGMIARTELPLTAGTWEFSTLSDDGVRVIVDGKPLIDNWTWHVPTRDTAALTLTEDKQVELTVEHFEIDGYAVLELDIAKK